MINTWYFTYRIKILPIVFIKNVSSLMIFDKKSNKQINNKNICLHQNLFIKQTYIDYTEK